MVRPHTKDFMLKIAYEQLDSGRPPWLKEFPRKYRELLQ
jgi:hypothetical protein